MTKYTNEIKVAIDADSLVYKSCYRHQTSDGCGVNIEQAYLEFGYEVGKIKSAVFRLLKYEKGDKVVPIIVLSPKHTFRHELSSAYKEKRPVGETIHGIKQLKLMIMHRLDNAEVYPKIEADDVVIWYAKEKQYLVAAIDKDVINACPTSCYNYNSRYWNEPHLPHEIEAWYIKQALMGDNIDGVAGAQDIGAIRAQRWVDKFIGEPYSWSEFVDMFGDEHLAILSMNLVRMDRLRRINGELVHVPWRPFEDSYWQE
jgi:5'-3' exonuclease